jgi:hypothetical protein
LHALLERHSTLFLHSTAPAGSAGGDRTVSVRIAAVLRVARPLRRPRIPVAQRIVGSEPGIHFPSTLDAPGCGLCRALQPLRAQGSLHHRQGAYRAATNGDGLSA